VWEGNKPGYRAMQEAVCEAGWYAEALWPCHRRLIAPEQWGRGREVSALDWTLVHPERGPHIYGPTKSSEYVEKRRARVQTTVTAGIANRQVIEGIDVQIQAPKVSKEEEAYLQATGQASDEQMEQVRTRLLDLRHHMEPTLAYKKRTVIGVEMVQQ
jgi:hypothetical protein